MSFKEFFSKQAQRPSGLFGRMIMSQIFEKGNAPLNALIKGQVAPRKTDHILEIGFGTGVLIRNMTEDVSRGVIEGIDFSETMVSIAKKKNRRYIASGRVVIRKGRFEEQSYHEDFFDKICSANTIYFWSDPVGTAQKIRRILKPGGKLVLGFEDGEQMKKKPLSSKIFRFYSPADVKQLLIDCGFTGAIDIVSEERKLSILNCVVAVK